MVEYATIKGSNKAFDQFCAVVGKAVPWIGRDLKKDLRIERGDFTVPQDILEETSFVVHKLVVR